jgi:DNA-directed RNA polymerase specialized sigma24 family protein
MDRMRTLGLLDSNGKPLAERIQRALAKLLPKVRRQFPSLRDDLALTEIIEEAGRRIASREERGGQIEQLHAYAWVTLRSVATSHLRKPANRLIRDTVGSTAGEIHIASVEASYGSPQDVERQVLIREAMDALSDDERMVCIWKTAGSRSAKDAPLPPSTHCSHAPRPSCVTHSDTLPLTAQVRPSQSR